MTIHEFRDKYYLKFSQFIEEDVYVSRTCLYERISNCRVDFVETRNAVTNLDNWILSSQSIISVTPWTFDQFFNEVMRAQFDHYCRLLPISGFFPLDRKSNPDLTSFYI